MSSLLGKPQIQTHFFLTLQLSKLSYILNLKGKKAVSIKTD